MRFVPFRQTLQKSYPISFYPTIFVAKFAIMSKISQIGSIFLLLLFMAKAMVVPIVYLDYELRKDYIKSVLCVNKNRPEMHCDGKCYLAKRIAAAQKQEESQAEKDFVSKLVEIDSTNNIFGTYAIQFHLISFVIEKLDNFFYIKPPLNQAHLSIFHPPQC